MGVPWMRSQQGHLRKQGELPELIGSQDPNSIRISRGLNLHYKSALNGPRTQGVRATQIELSA